MHRDFYRMLVLLIVICIVRALCYGCSVTRESTVGFLMGKSTEDATEFLEAYGRIEDCYKTYDAVWIDENGVARSTKATFRYNCVEDE